MTNLKTLFLFFWCTIMGGTALWADSLPWASTHTAFPTISVYAEFEKLDVLPEEVVTLIIRGFMEPGWHIYSVKPQNEYGPEPTWLSFQTLHQTVGDLEENPPLVVDDQALGLRLAVHKESFVFKQSFKIAADALPALETFEGTLHYQICDNNICAPLQSQPFSTPLTIGKKTSQP